MTTLQEMHIRISSNTEYDRMIRSVRPMCDYFDVNHFYCARIKNNKHSFSYNSIGTHLDWCEYLFDNPPLLISAPFMRQPHHIRSQIIIEKNTSVPIVKDVLDRAWIKFGINFTIVIQRKTSEGSELYGFGVNFNHPKAEERLLNEFPLLNRFITFFHKENKKLIDNAEDHQVDLLPLINPCVCEIPNFPLISSKREKLLKQLGIEAALALTKREMDVLKFIAHGFPANYIAQQLHLSHRTVENYIAAIKSKLDCNSKVELIIKSQEIISIANSLEIYLEKGQTI